MRLDAVLGRTLPLNRGRLFSMFVLTSSYRLETLDVDVPFSPEASRGVAHHGRHFTLDPILLTTTSFVMTQNMGSLDRLLRTAAAIAVGALYATGTIGGTTALILGVFAAVFLLTSFVGVCPLYMPFGLSTMRKTLTQ
jgi:hypothetical protein